LATYAVIGEVHHKAAAAYRAVFLIAIAIMLSLKLFECSALKALETLYQNIRSLSIAAILS
jgi:hypothetical protein